MAPAARGWSRIPAGSKFGNLRQREDGYTFDSKAELSRYRELRLLQRAGCIADLVVHPRYDLWVGEVKVCRYVADFAYLDRTAEPPRRVVEDVKGVRTAAYRIKKQLMLACLGITISEVEA